ncbi:BACON domain-containing protein [Dokdonella soli]|uniref:BACON domain-containing protein n=1 Tax=Dokdonella soli TaxID=529810 RepID=A0ABN1ITK2_9GAMM
MLGLILTVGAVLSVHAAAPDAARTTAAVSQQWSVSGGEVGVSWNRDLAGDIGLRIAAPSTQLADAPDHHFERFAVRRSDALGFRVENGHFRGFSGGALQVRGGYVIDLPDGRIDLTHFRLVPSTDDPFLLDLVSADGKAWFYVDRLMYETAGRNNLLAVRSMDLRISAQLATRLGQPMVAGWAIADMELNSEVLSRGAQLAPTATCDVNSGANCHFAGIAAPNSGTYQADLFMESFTPQYSRCQGCTGPSGSGQVVFTPSSTLKNNVNAGSIQTTIPGQGALGVSSALWAADIAWFEMFSGNFPPYGNDQHPYLIWNMYRINADGSIEQIGRSGLKHAYLTVNGGASCPYTEGHVLGVTCEDNYGTGSNDNGSRLGPRSEVIPATNQWGRCGSIYDVNCNGVNDNPNNGSYAYRLVVGESQISATANPGASWLFESWYLARDDINIYNSMGTVATAQNWSPPNPPAQGFWGISASGYKLGPAIDRWVSPTAPPANTGNTELAVTEGHAKLAVKATNLGGGIWRYDYAVMNLDFSRATTQGSEPNLKVLSNKGFDSFSVPLPAGATVSATRFSNGDLSAANDWSVSTSGGSVTWTAQASGPTLDWGSLYAFSLTVNVPPGSVSSTLHVAQTGSPASFHVATLGPVSGAPSQPLAAISPASLALSVVAGASTSGPFTIGNSGDAGSTLHYTIDVAPTSCASPSAVAWLSASPTSGSVAQGAAAATITTTANAASLAAGSYSAQVCVRSDDPAHALIAVPVTLTVTPPPPTAAVSPGSLSLSVVAGASTSGPFTIGNTGATGSMLHYTIDVAPTSCASPSAVTWLSASPTSGSVAQGATAATVTATANAANLTAGSYSAQVCVHSDDPAHAVIAVPVALTVSAPPAASVSPGSFRFTVVGNATGSGTLDITNTGAAGTTLQFTIAMSDHTPVDCAHPNSVAWLRATPTSGSVAMGAVAAAISVQANSNGLAFGNHAATLCVGTNDPAQPTIQVPVNLVVLDPNDVIFIDGFDGTR